MKDKIAAASRELGALDDKLVEYIKKIEDSLRSYFSVRVWTQFNDEIRLVYGKHRGAWSLIVSRENGRVEQTLLSSPRNLRQEVLTGGHIERLIREGAEQIEAQISEREHAIKEAERILAALEGARP